MSERVVLRLIAIYKTNPQLEFIKTLSIPNLWYWRWALNSEACLVAVAATFWIFSGPFLKPFDHTSCHMQQDRGHSHCAGLVLLLCCMCGTTLQSCKYVQECKIAATPADTLTALNLMKQLQILFPILKVAPSCWCLFPKHPVTEDKSCSVFFFTRLHRRCLEYASN